MGGPHREKRLRGEEGPARTRNPRRKHAPQFSFSYMAQFMFNTERWNISRTTNQNAPNGAKRRKRDRAPAAMGPEAP